MKKNIIEPFPKEIQEMSFDDYVRLATLKKEDVDLQRNKTKKKKDR